MLETDLLKPRCFWCNLKNPVYIAYHDNEWGVPCENERSLYELFILETFQAGLSWECILNKRGNFRTAYDNFNIDKVCLYGAAKTEELMLNSGIIRNRAKIEASIANSRIYKDIAAEFGGFGNYLRSFTGGKILREPDQKVTTNEWSDSISKDLKKRGMRFVGSTTIYAFLQAAGIINSHAEVCFCSPEYMNRR